MMWCVLYLCLLLTGGYAVVPALARRSSPLERLGLMLCMGPAVMGFALLLASMAGFRPERMEIIAIAAALAAIGFVAQKKLAATPAIPQPPGRVSSWWIAACLIALAYGFLAIVLDACVYPVMEWDAFAIWQLKAIVLALYPLHPTPAYFTDLNLSYSHLRYPLLVPMMSAGMHAMNGRLDDLGKTLSLLFFPGMALAVFSTVRRINGATAALTAVTLLVCLEPFFRYGGSGTAEMAFTAFYACSLLCLLHFIADRDVRYLVLCGIFSAWMAWTKNEGIALSVVNAIVLAVMRGKTAWKRSLRDAAIFAAVVAILYLPWVIFSWGLPRTDEDYASHLTIRQLLANVPRLGEILLWYGKELIDWQDWGIFWVLIAGLALAERRRFASRPIAVVGLLLVLHLLAYIPPLMVTTWKLNELLSVTLDRLFMHAAPAGAILFGLLWPAWAGGTERTSAEPMNQTD